jgi:tetratricopeptide (TPR) repeat protein
MNRAWCGVAAAVFSLACGLRPGRAEDDAAVAAQAQNILRSHCYRCHGQDGANEGGFNYVLDRNQLVARKKIVPGEPDKSRLFRRVTSQTDPMPPEDEPQRPSAEDLAALKRWIERGATDFSPPRPERAIVTPAQIDLAIQTDLQQIVERDRRFTRYFSIAHLYNAGLSEDELQSYRHALSKLVNSLSWGSRVAVPAPVDRPRTIFRIDLRDYQWNESVWEALVAAYPYGVTQDSEPARWGRSATQTRLPCLRADWFVAAASRPPLYHQVLQLPASDRELERQLRVDAAQNIRQARVARAGFNSSGVSRNNRLIERHESGHVVYWKSYDFASNVDRQNLFAYPLGPDGDADATFRHDGGEIIFNLPNGLQAYMLVDGQGRRIDKGPVQIVSDPKRPDRAVENGLSCMSCHAKGIIDKADQVRDHVASNAAAFSTAQRNIVAALYPPREAMAALMRRDGDRFRAAVEATGASLSVTEPVAALAQRFEAELDVRLAAAEVSAGAQALLAALGRSPRLGQQLGPLRIEGGTVQRQVFVAAFPELVAELRVGEYVEPTLDGYTRRIADGRRALDAGLLAAAIEAYSAAIELDGRSAAAFAARAEAYRKAGELQRAIDDCDQAIRLDSTLPAAYLARAAAWHDQGRFDRAFADYGEAIRLAPDDPIAFNNRGLAHFDQRDYARAIADFNHAIRLDPGYATAYRNRGLAHDRTNDHDTAIADYTEAIRIDPSYGLAYQNRAATHHRKRDYDRAIADYTTALRLDPRSAVVLNNRGYAYLEKREFERAVADFTTAVRLDAKFTAAYYNRGLAYNLTEQYVKAVAEFSEAIRLDPRFARAYQQRSLAHSKLGRAAQAESDRAAAVRLDPSLDRD